MAQKKKVMCTLNAYKSGTINVHAQKQGLAAIFSFQYIKGFLFWNNK